LFGIINPDPTALAVVDSGVIPADMGSVTIPVE